MPIEHFPTNDGSRQLVPFNYNSQEIRVIRDANGDAWFIAGDVCRVLNIGNVSASMSRLDDDEKGITTIDTPSGSQPTLIINEAGLYNLTLTSRKAAAKDFRRWITHDVIPSIRKTGQYALTKMTPAEIGLYHAQQLVDHERRLAAAENAVERIEARQTAIEKGSDYFTILAFSNLNSIEVDNVTAQRLGKLCSKLSRERSVIIGDVTDPRFGVIHTYHSAILQDVFTSVGLLIKAV